jgi:5,10-methylene-tetrahydrofolate dehydrogenase/methenyl tetrahydrofolate cyclohydrolase
MNQKIIEKIKIEKDVDCLLSQNMGNLSMRGREPLVSPCTPSVIVELLKRYEIEISGKRAVVVGRSNIVGLPISLMLTKLDATVTITHSKTVDLPSIISESDIVISAVGSPRFIKGDWLKEGCVVVDAGVSLLDGHLVGDVDFDSAKTRTSYITPVPGGVGPMTVAILMRNTFLLSNIK